MTERLEVAFTEEQLAQLIATVPDDVVLVGGQSLAFWVDRYGIDRAWDIAAAISRDADFLGKRSDVEHIAAGMHSKAIFPPNSAITAIVGQVSIDIGGNEFLNVDVIHRLVGVDAAAVRRRAVTVTTEKATFKVLHPIDVLQTRVANLASKQNPAGVRQVSLAIQVAKAFLLDVARNPEVPQGQRIALAAIEKIVEIGKSSTGRAMLEHGLNVFDAVAPEAIDGPQFHAERLPRIREEAAACRAPQCNTPKLKRSGPRR
ncbi:MAG: hypothetical protein ACXWJK_00580 [Burkholderiaceae bacterium]